MGGVQQPFRHTHPLCGCSPSGSSSRTEERERKGSTGTHIRFMKDSREALAAVAVETELFPLLLASVLATSSDRLGSPNNAPGRVTAVKLSR